MIERSLVRKILSGDKVAEERFVREHYPRILRFLRHLSGCTSDAEDLTQNTFLRAKIALPEFRHECSLSTWLHRIAYREFGRSLRDQRDDKREIPEGALAYAQRSDDAIVLAAAIRSLPDDSREVFVLREIQRLSVVEVATVLNIPSGTVKSRHHFARARLRTALGGTWNTDMEKNPMETRHESV